jgi:hypothetical protein
MSGIAMTLFFILGFVLSIAGYIWGLVQAFQQEIFGDCFTFLSICRLGFSCKILEQSQNQKSIFNSMCWLANVLLQAYYMYFVSNLQALASGVNVQQGSSEQSPSSFPSDFNTSPSPIQEQSPDPSPQMQHQVLSLILVLLAVNNMTSINRCSLGN